MKKEEIFKNLIDLALCAGFCEAAFTVLLYYNWNLRRQYI